MRSSKQTLGIVSLVCLFFGIAAFALTQRFSLFVVANLGFGLFALVSYLATAREGFGTFLGERSTRYGANAAVYSLLFVGVVVVLNFLAARHFERFDMTEQNVFSLSEQSVNEVRKLEQDLTIQAFVETGKDPALEDLLKTYAAESDRVKWEMIDPDKRPELAQRYNVTAYGTVRIAYGENSTLVNELDEEAITNGILRVTSTTKKTVCLVEGHGEPAGNDSENPKGYQTFRLALESENFDVKSAFLGVLEKAPADCSLLIVASPEKPYLEGELKVLKSYLDGGGRAVFLLEARKGAELAPLLATYGITLGENVVVDQVIRLFQGPALGLEPIVQTYGEHPITQDFTQRTLFPMVRSVELAPEPKPGVQGVSIAKTSNSSWAETDLDALFQKSQAAFDATQDVKGPISIGVAATVNLQEVSGTPGESRIVVFGSHQWVDNKQLNGLYNRDLALNAVNWAVGEDKNIAIRARGIRASRVQLTEDQVSMIFYLSVLVLPELLLLAGITVWARRRNA